MAIYHNDCVNFILDHSNIALEKKDIQWGKQVTSIHRDGEGLYKFIGDWTSNKTTIISKLVVFKVFEYPEDEYWVLELRADNLHIVSSRLHRRHLLGAYVLNKMDLIMDNKKPDSSSTVEVTIPTVESNTTLESINSLDELFSMLPEKLKLQLIQEDIKTDSKLLALKRALERNLDTSLLIL